MQIRRVILKNVRSFVDFDCTFQDSWSDRIPESLLLIGPNGSGKTTLLDAIASLWELFANCLEAREKEPGDELPVDIPKVISSSDLAAMEIVRLEHEPVWVYHGSKIQVSQFIREQVESHRIGAYYQGKGEFRSVGDGYVEPGMTELSEKSDSFRRPDHWVQRLTENILGKREDLPNVVYLESETRTLLPIEEKFSVQPEPEEFRWLARYAPTTARKGSLHNYLYNLKVVDEDAFQAIVDQVNAFLIGKRLAGFNRRGPLMVQVDGGDTHSIDDFSSGEKQVLLMIATITRWLRPGGIVLIDEPDLHLHPSLTTAFVGHLRRMIADEGGQLLIASHAPELWQEFTPSRRVELGAVEMDEVRR